VAVGVIAGVEVGLNVAVGIGVAVGSGAMEVQAANSMKTSPVSRTRRFIISSFGNMRRLISAALLIIFTLTLKCANCCGQLAHLWVDSTKEWYE
jgi:hypothetical protein